MVSKAQQNGLITGLVDHIIPHGVAILKNDMEGAVNMKLLLYIYEMMAGLKINFNKSEVK